MTKVPGFVSVQCSEGCPVRFWIGSLKTIVSRFVLIQGAFVAAFANTNEGDVTPDVQGAFCTDTGEPCDYVTSTCPSNPIDVSDVTS